MQPLNASKPGDSNGREFQFSGFRSCLSGVVFEMNLNLQLISSMPDRHQRRACRKECVEIGAGYPLELTRVYLVEGCLVDAEQADTHRVGTTIRRLEAAKAVD